MFSTLVVSATPDGLISGKLVAIDAIAIDSYEKPIPKKNLVDNGSHANWGTKLDTHGNQHTWFGYKLHLAVYTASVLSIAIQVTPEYTSDDIAFIEDWCNMLPRKILGYKTSAELFEQS